VEKSNASSPAPSCIIIASFSLAIIAASILYEWLLIVIGACVCAVDGEAVIGRWNE